MGLTIRGSAEWRKSGFCQNKNCAEVGVVHNQIAVRNSKNPAGPMLIFTVDEWEAFICGANAGEFDIDT